MCRLLGYVGQPVHLRHELMEAENSFLNQSVCDRDACKPNDDGWGCGFEDNNGGMAVVKSVGAPRHDAKFKAQAERPYSRALFHIRRASVGQPSLDNTHPWQFGDEMVFAHNGSIYGFEKFRDEAMRFLPEALRHRVKGDTDSEYAMFLLAHCLEKRGDHKNIATVRDALRETIGMLERWSEQSGETKKPKLNFMLLTPYHLIATRVIHSLGYYSNRKNGVLITSEALTGKDNWKTLENYTMIAVDRASQIQIFDLN